MTKCKALMLGAAIVVFGMFLTVGCAGTYKSSGSKAVSYGQLGGQAGKGPVNEAELQQSLLRYEGRASSLIIGALQPLINSPVSRVHDAALKTNLQFLSALIDISSGPSPPVNLLDMVAFVELARSVVSDELIPKYFGNAGLPLKAAMDECSTDIWAVASKVLNANQQQTLKKLIQDYRKANPLQVNVALIRLSEFASELGDKADQEEYGGMLASVQGAAQEAESARLLGERLLHYAERAPFLLRFHTQILMDDLLKQISAMSAKMAAREEDRIARGFDRMRFELEELIKIRTRALFQVGVELIVVLFVAVVMGRVLASYLSFRLIERRKAKSERASSEKLRKVA